MAIPAVLLWPLIATVLAAQTQPSDLAPNQNSKPDPALATLRVTTREVLVDLVALDPHNHPVLDLKPDELQVSESAATEPKSEEQSDDTIASGSVDPITSLSIFDPNNPASTRDTGTGFRILASCLERSTVHYLLAFRPGPSSWTSGYHHIAITSTRANMRLFYRHQYYVGLAAPAPNSPVLKQKEVDRILQQSACYYPVTPLSIGLQARLIDTGRTDVVRYLVSADTSSISFPAATSNATGRELAGIDRRVALHYGICNFDERGKPTRAFH
jgi:hypothetical protein